MTGQSPTRDVVPPERRAYRHLAAVVLFVAVIAGGLAADLLSKHFVFQSFLGNPELAAQLARVQALADRDLKNVPARDAMRIPQVSGLLQRRVMPGLKFTLSTNPGIVFGATMIPRAMVNLATVLTIILVIGFFATSDRAAYGSHIALACIIGGALGNLYDRLFSVVRLPADWVLPIANEVRDFIDFSDLGYVWVFNIADVLLVVGVALLILTWMRPRRKKQAAAQGQS